MEDRDAVAEPPGEASDELRRERDLGHQDDRAASRGQRRLDEADVDLGLAAAGDAVQQEGREGLRRERRAQDGERLRLRAREDRRGVAAPRGAEPPVDATADLHLLGRDLARVDEGFHDRRDLAERGAQRRKRRGPALAEEPEDGHALRRAPAEAGECRLVERAGQADDRLAPRLRPVLSDPFGERDEAPAPERRQRSLPRPPGPRERRSEEEAVGGGGQPAEQPSLGRVGPPLGLERTGGGEPLRREHEAARGSRREPARQRRPADLAERREVVVGHPAQEVEERGRHQRVAVVEKGGDGLEAVHLGGLGEADHVAGHLAPAEGDEHAVAEGESRVEGRRDEVVERPPHRQGDGDLREGTPGWQGGDRGHGG